MLALSVIVTTIQQVNFCRQVAGMGQRNIGQAVGPRKPDREAGVAAERISRFENRTSQRV